MRIDEPNNLACPYCGKDAEWVENKEIYGKNYGKSYMAWLCRDCDAYVGCHGNTRRPFGTMADKDTRAWRIRAHSVVDPLWSGGTVKRGDVYKMLSDHFGFEVHIGSADIALCRDIIEYVADEMFTGKNVDL